MKRIPSILGYVFTLVAMLTAMSSLHAQDKSTADLSGYWLFTVDYIGMPMPRAMLLKEDRGLLSGEYVNDPTKISGTFGKNKIQFIARTADGKETRYQGEYANGLLSGMAGLPEPVTGKILQARWTARRFAMENPGKQKKIAFMPNAFHLGYAADIAPALHCWPGDTIQTETVDCNGFDKQGVHRVMEGNAEIGPIFIESALPGDLLIIHFLRIRLNRDWASSAVHLMGRSVSHDYAAHAKLDESVVHWKLDLEKGLARPGDHNDHLQNYVLPVKPMLGCVGVAPGFGTYPFPAIDSGPFGGNMDFVAMNEGTTLYLPVFQPGALLFMGDGHALQGDGELNLDALETSLDVEFTVELKKGAAARLGQPRAENNMYLMAIGLNGSLDEAFRDATSEMANWLEQDFGLPASEVAIVLGTSIEYQITEVADRNVSVVAKINKNRLNAIQKSVPPGTH